ncbi:Mediator of RNA polymerase II transcription subunit 18 [Toxocara canis]|uniref:Mediator of RNA polymerase II transcription subunit 18 n=2 Tax=Toxocara canis TaxID=6265 RepID=A0A0B2VI38_TOXCA|nr:Mediator of RNA polymerase II transcription subunit 18 [Toxocara canis]
MEALSETMDPLSSREMLANVPLTAPSNASLAAYQCQECILYGSVLKEYEKQLIQRLRGLCDPGQTEFSEHEMTFSLKTGQDPDVTVRLRRKFGGSDANSLLWHFRYMSAPEADTTCPTIIRKSIDSLIYSHDMMEFVKTLGLRMDYEYITKGYLFTKGNIKIVIDNITRTEKTGTYDPNLLKPLSDSLLIEMSVAQPDSKEYITTAKMLRDFADQLLPICDMQKVEYWRRQ